MFFEVLILVKSLILGLNLDTVFQLLNNFSWSEDKETTIIQAIKGGYIIHHWLSHKIYNMLINWSKSYLRLHLYEISKKIYRDKKVDEWLTRAGGEENGEWLLMSIKFLWGRYKCAKIKLWLMVAQFCEYAKNYWDTNFKWVNFMLCELYLNKAI